MHTSPTVRLCYLRRGAYTADTVAMLWLLLFLVLVGYGIKLYLTSSAYKAPVVVSLAEFVKQEPKSGWYTVKDCQLDMAHTVNWEENNVTIEVNAPILGLPRSAPQIYASLTDSKTLSAFVDLGYARKKGPAEARSFVQQHYDVFHQRKDVSGLVTVGKRDPMGEWQQAGVEAATVVCIEDGWQPNFKGAYAAIGIGLAMCGVCVAVIVRARRR